MAAAGAVTQVSAAYASDNKHSAGIGQGAWRRARWKYALATAAVMLVCGAGLAIWGAQNLQRSELDQQCVEQAQIVRSISQTAQARADAALRIAETCTAASNGTINLRGAFLERASLAAAQLKSADLTGADLNRAILTGADLRGATLVRANAFFQTSKGPVETNFVGADLRGADLREADLRKANLTGALLTEARLDGAVFDESTKWPAGFDPNLHGARKIVKSEDRHIASSPLRTDLEPITSSSSDRAPALDGGPSLRNKQPKRRPTEISQLKEKVWSHRATLDEIQELLSICIAEGDESCQERTRAARKLSMGPER